MLSMEPYPDGTEKVIAAIYDLSPSYSEDLKGRNFQTEQDLYAEFPKRLEIADWSGLSKQDVRYRLQQLTDDYVVMEMRVERGPGQLTHHYQLDDSGEEFIQSTEVLERVLGEVPGNLRVEHLRELAAEVGRLEERADEMDALEERVDDLAERLEEIEADDSPADDEQEETSGSSGFRSTRSDYR